MNCYKFRFDLFYFIPTQKYFYSKLLSLSTFHLEKIILSFFYTENWKSCLWK